MGLEVTLDSVSNREKHRSARTRPFAVYGENVFAGCTTGVEWKWTGEFYGGDTSTAHNRFGLQGRPEWRLSENSQYAANRSRSQESFCVFTARGELRWVGQLQHIIRSPDKP
jgi:hypothetical protein